MHGHTLGVSRGHSDFVPRLGAERCWIDGDLIRLGAWPVGGVRPGGRAGPVPWLIDLSVLETAMRSVYGDRFRLGARAPLLQMAANLLAEGDRRNAEAFAAKVSFPLPDYAGRFHDACAKHLAWGAAHRPGNPPIDVAAWVEHAVALEQKFNPNQPRVPRGHPEGGQWVDDPFSGASDFDAPVSDAEWEWAHNAVDLIEAEFADEGQGRDAGFLHFVAGREPPRSPPPNRWDNLLEGEGSPDLLPKELPQVDLPEGHPEPKIPRTLPTIEVRPKRNPKTRGRLVRSLVTRLSRLRSFGRFSRAIEVVSKVLFEYPEVYTYFDEPLSLEDLQDAARTESEKGYEDHHIIEQNQPDADALGVDSPSNIVRIPTIAHRIIGGHYSSKPHDLNGLTVRQWVRRQGPEFQREYGLWILRWYGVLK